VVVVEGLDLSILVELLLLPGSSSSSNSIKLGIRSNFHAEGKEAVVEAEAELVSQGGGVPVAVNGIETQ
jgi:hypothetical protein